MLEEKLAYPQSGFCMVECIEIRAPLGVVFSVAVTTSCYSITLYNLSVDDRMVYDAIQSDNMLEIEMVMIFKLEALEGYDVARDATPN